MNKFEKARVNVDLVEAASKAAIGVAWNKIRYDSTYFDYVKGEPTDWYNDEWLEAHLTDDGRECLKMAKEIAGRIDRLL